MWSQVGIRKHHYEQRSWRWWNSSWAISNPERWCCESAALNMLADLETSAVAMGLEKVIFHSSHKESHCQRISNYWTVALISQIGKVMLKILQTRLQQYMNHELPDVQAVFRKSRRTNDQIANMYHWKSKRVPDQKKKKKSTFAFFTPNPFTVYHNKLWKILKEMGIPDHFTCLLRNMYAGEETTVRTGHGITDWSQIRKGVHQGCILSPC